MKKQLCLGLIMLMATMVGCQTIRKEGQRIVKRLSLPATLEGTNAEIDQQQKQLESLRASRVAFESGAKAIGVENTAFVKETLARQDENIKDGEDWLSRLESWKQAQEAALVQKVVDGKPIESVLPTPEPAK